MSQCQEITSLVQNTGNKRMCHHIQKCNNFKIRFPQSHHAQYVHKFLQLCYMYVFKYNNQESSFPNETQKIVFYYSYSYKHWGFLSPQTYWLLNFITGFEGSSTLNLLSILNYLHKLVVIYLVANFVRLFHYETKTY